MTALLVPAPANARRGEVSAVLGGRAVTLCLTLGALAELEAALGAGDLADLGERLSRGRLSAREVAALLRCGLRGAGGASDAEAVEALPAAELPACLDAVAQLLAATFGEPEPARPAPPAGEGGGPRPFG